MAITRKELDKGLTGLFEVMNGVVTDRDFWLAVKDTGVEVEINGSHVTIIHPLIVQSLGVQYESYEDLKAILAEILSLQGHLGR